MQEYSVGELLGKGGFGNVYKAVHIATDKTVAIKMVCCSWKVVKIWRSTRKTLSVPVFETAFVMRYILCRASDNIGCDSLSAKTSFYSGGYFSVNFLIFDSFTIILKILKMSIWFLNSPSSVKYNTTFAMFKSVPSLSLKVCLSFVLSCWECRKFLFRIFLLLSSTHSSASSVGREISSLARHHPQRSNGN